MNPKFRDLQIQAFAECKTFEDGQFRTDEVFERFAQLIVRECAKIIEDEAFNNYNKDKQRHPDSFEAGHGAGMFWAVGLIKEHFGIDGEEDIDETCPRCGDTWSGTSCGISDCGWVTGVEE